MKISYKNILTLLRPEQWVKNLLVLASLIFSKHFWDFSFTLRVIEAFFVFCLLSSSVYILNDFFDLSEDRLHPTKCLRPLAAGRVPMGFALGLAAVLVFSSLTAAFALSKDLFWVCFSYFLLQTIYSLGLKHVVLLDVLSIACGFVLRAVAGAVVIHVELSPWLLLCTFLLTLFLGLGKRREEGLILEHQGDKVRPVLSHYPLPFLDALISVVTGATVVSYALYTVSPEVVQKFGTTHLIYTLPFVIYGIFRYLYLLHQRGGGDNPARVFLKDFALQMNVLVWLVACFWIIYD
ncbi:MAG: decaprenyl-phosphate phosphoribosyltransferase [Chlamydiae bacterium]|nr:decaprenyl-phosphate phosphoribosyltransferase [Chlamydiota bacterium]MBI3277616.1 decaprenyl-phosphate phosphoribosyltransferase [Chlamydiota bacterium]